MEANAAREDMAPIGISRYSLKYQPSMVASSSDYTGSRPLYTKIKKKWDAMWVRLKIGNLALTLSRLGYIASEHCKI